MQVTVNAFFSTAFENAQLSDFSTGLKVHLILDYHFLRHAAKYRFFF